ncbi:MAG: efflux RND transporter periplasmic adaptor subunit [Deltaproteobacteria bacterium]|jgi:RND family efflux transporter MFP subunit|nr:efflux RND transporter periplasmic adaptor subunit [Deltaproteobacteria bacterium]
MIGYSGSRRSSRPKRTLAFGLVMVLAGGCSRPLPERKATAVRVMEAVETVVQRQARYSANILPATRVDLMFKIGGYVENLAETKGPDGKMRLLNEGDRVEKGQLLARVKAGEVTEKLGEVRAMGSGAAAQQEMAKQEFERARTLFERGAISKSQFDAARAGYRAATAQSAAASAGAAQVRSAIADMTLRSPIDGVILKRLVEVGTLVGPGVPGFIVADTTSVKASFGVPDTQLGALKLGSPISVTIEALPGQQFSGSVSRVAPSADLATRVFEVETSIPNPSGVLKTGMVATVRLGDLNEAKPEVLLPLSAIVRSPRDANAFAVFVVKTEGAIERVSLRDVQLGEIYANFVPATQGIAPKERVVVMGTGLLSDGQEVRIIPEEDGARAAAQ